jgi:ABC-type multidrug transport system fused ATPase/permease subunit
MSRSTAKMEPAPGRRPAEFEVAHARSSPQSDDAVVAAAQNSDSERVNFWRFLWPSIYPYRWLVLAALFLNALHGFSITLQTVAPKYLIDDVILVNGITMTQRWHRLALLLALYIIASIFGRMLVWHAGYRIFTYVREKVLFNVRATFFRHVNHLCVRFHRQHHSGELFSYLFGSPLLQMQTYFQQVTFAAPGALFIVITTLVWVGRWDWLLTLVMLTTVFSTVWVMHRTRAKIQKLHGDYQRTETSVTGYVADLLRGSRDVKLYAMEDQVAADFDNRVWEVGQKSYQRDVKAHIQWMKWETTGYFCFAMLCAAIAWRYFYDQSHKPPDKRVTIGELQIYLTAFASLQANLSILFQMSNFRAAAQAGVERIAAVLKTASTTPDPIGGVAQIPESGQIVLHNVTFGYDSDRAVLKDVNLTIPYGQRIALVGPSGAGKSTITQLLLRLYDPDQGAILIGGLNIRHCQGAELRRRFGVVPQDPFIFRTSIRDNLCVARPGAADADIRRACERANAWEFIARLPDGLETPVGEGGSTLSGGQRQRLAIARALLAEPEFFIFDEATSALDTVSEKLVQEAMENAVAGKTALIIAHRLATVKNCDRILVIDDGRVIQDGTYDSLVSQTGLFKNLVQGQVLKG